MYIQIDAPTVIGDAQGLAVIGENVTDYAQQPVVKALEQAAQGQLAGQVVQLAQDWMSGTTAITEALNNLSRAIQAAANAMTEMDSKVAAEMKADSTHTVQAGDNLSSIAAIATGSQANEPAIYAANKGTVGSNPNIIQPGQVLNIPADLEKIAPVPVPKLVLPPALPKGS